MEDFDLPGLAWCNRFTNLWLSTFLNAKQRFCHADSRRLARVSEEQVRFAQLVNALNKDPPGHVVDIVEKPFQHSGGDCCLNTSSS
jgi:hypothetical protein